MENSSDPGDGDSSRVKQTVRGGLGKAFASCSLPSTMKMARRFYLDVVDRLIGIHSEWPFEDRVLLWLLPNMEQETLDFHTRRGGNIATLFADHQLAHFDQALSQELGRRLEQAPPAPSGVAAD